MCWVSKTPLSSAGVCLFRVLDAYFEWILSNLFFIAWKGLDQSRASIVCKLFSQWGNGFASFISSSSTSVYHGNQFMELFLLKVICMIERGFCGESGAAGAVCLLRDTHQTGFYPMGPVFAVWVVLCVWQYSSWWVFSCLQTIAVQACHFISWRPIWRWWEEMDHCIFWVDTWCLLCLLYGLPCQCSIHPEAVVHPIQCPSLWKQCEQSSPGNALLSSGHWSNESCSSQCETACFFVGVVYFYAN